MNRLNVEFAAFSAGAALPFLAVIDVGVSSSGFIELVRNALPPERRHEAYYVRLLNTPDYAVNFLDLGLGRRMPLERERSFIENFLTTLLNVSNPEVALLVPRLISRVFQLKSDLQFSSSPAVYQPDVDPELDRIIHDFGIAVADKARWWSIVDALVERRLFNAAQRAQRYAMPVLEDFARVLAEPIMVQDFPAELIRHVQRSLESAIEKFPIFARPTRLDLGEARVVSIDLQDVAQRHKSPEAERNNALMFMIARHVYLSKISGFAEEIAKMDFPPEDKIRSEYVRYWEARYAEVAETPKRLCMDEYHLTGGVETIARQVKSDAREGRKWGLELIWSRSCSPTSTRWPTWPRPCSCSTPTRTRSASRRARPSGRSGGEVRARAPSARPAGAARREPAGAVQAARGRALDHSEQLARAPDAVGPDHQGGGPPGARRAVPPDGGQRCAAHPRFPLSRWHRHRDVEPDVRACAVR